MPEALQVFNTLTRQVEPLRPSIPGQVGIYTCGPTVYGYAHIGNMRSYIFADVLRRSLEFLGYKVRHVMNITDVGHLVGDGDDGEDKLELSSRREGRTAWDVARYYEQAFFQHAAMLNILRPSLVCRASEHIAEQIAMVDSLYRRGFAYHTSDGIYFDTQKFGDYARLARLDVEGLREGHRVEIGEKHAKTDFALWKFSRPEEHRCMEWQSPWGRGFPGWHIECSAMALRHLGQPIDIHTGGVDHIPIHHTNEIAQSECATGAKFVRVWMHGEFLVLEDEKMSKSLGNVLTVTTLKDKGFAPLSFRFLALQSHYRKQLRFSEANLQSAARGLERLSQAARRAKAEAGAQAEAPGVAWSARAVEHHQAFVQALNNDLNTPQAIAVAYSVIDDASLDAVDKVRLISSFESVLALDLFKEPEAAAIPQELEAMLAARNAARASKNWAEADRLRQEIASRGYDILDSAQGSSLRPKS